MLIHKKQIKYFILVFIFIYGCNEVDVVGETCNGKTVAKSLEKKSECYILKKWWSEKEIPLHIVTNLPHSIDVEIRKAELKLDQYKNKTTEERMQAIRILRTELEIYNQERWKIFVKVYKSGDKIYFYSSNNNWAASVGMGYIMVRNSKVIAQFEFASE